MATTTERATQEREGRIFAHTLATAAAINRGAMVVLDAGDAKPGAVAVGLVAVGIAMESADQDAGDGSVRAKLGTFLLANSTTDPCGPEDVGTACFIEDDETVSATDDGGARSLAGTVRAMEGTDGVWVEFD